MSPRRPLVRPLFDDGEVAATLTDYPPRFRQGHHAHEHASLSLVLRGAVEETFGRQSESALPLSVVLKPAGCRHADRFGPAGCTTVQLRFLREAPRHWERLRWHHAGGPVIASFLALIEASLPAATPGSASSEAANRELATAEVLASLDGLPSARGEPPRWILGVKEMLDDADPAALPSLAALSAHAGVAPAHLTRSFRRHFGSSIRRYRKLRRLQAASAAVATGGRTLTGIAHELGYADQSHFCRDFRSCARTSASAFRRLLETIDRSGRSETYKPGRGR